MRTAQRVRVVVAPLAEVDEVPPAPCCNHCPSGELSLPCGEHRARGLREFWIDWAGTQWGGAERAKERRGASSTGSRGRVGRDRPILRPPGRPLGPPLLDGGVPGSFLARRSNFWEACERQHRAPQSHSVHCAWISLSVMGIAHTQSPTQCFCQAERRRWVNPGTWRPIPHTVSRRTSLHRNHLQGYSRRHNGSYGTELGTLVRTVRRARGNPPLHRALSIPIDV